MKSFLRLGKTWGHHVMIVLRLSWLLSKAKWVEIVWKVKLVPRGSHSSIAQSSLQASLKMSASDSLWGCVCNGNSRTPEVKERSWMTEVQEGKPQSLDLPSTRRASTAIWSTTAPKTKPWRQFPMIPSINCILLSASQPQATNRFGGNELLQITVMAEGLGTTPSGVQLLPQTDYGRQNYC